MFNQSLLVLVGAALLGTAVAPPATFAQTSDWTFSCRTDASGLPTTYATHISGVNQPVIRWHSQFFAAASYDNFGRCRQVSARFQRFYNDPSNRLNYVTAGIVNGLPVVCAAQSGGGCNSTNVLFTLKRDTDVPNVLQKLFAVRQGAGAPLYESGGRPVAPVGDFLNATLTNPGLNASSTTNSQPSSNPHF